jgi:hypothetical protein
MHMGPSAKAGLLPPRLTRNDIVDRPFGGGSSDFHDW